jgi:hypothetical protein
MTRKAVMAAALCVLAVSGCTTGSLFNSNLPTTLPGYVGGWQKPDFRERISDAAEISLAAPTEDALEHEVSLLYPTIHWNPEPITYAADWTSTDQMREVRGILRVDGNSVEYSLQPSQSVIGGYAYTRTPSENGGPYQGFRTDVSVLRILDLLVRSYIDLMSGDAADDDSLQLTCGPTSWYRQKAYAQTAVPIHDWYREVMVPMLAETFQETQAARDGSYYLLLRTVFPAADARAWTVEVLVLEIETGLFAVRYAFSYDGVVVEPVAVQSVERQTGGRQ